MEIEALFTPAEFRSLRERRLEDAVCVVFDVLRATTSIASALARGAQAVRAVGSISEALEERRRMPSALLAGERGGVRIGGALSGGVEFDLGNSPREFSAERVAGRVIVMTTTNGTLALQACAGAGEVFAAAFVNLSAVAKAVSASGRSRCLLVCGGTGEHAAYEDALAAGAMAEWLGASGAELADSALIAAGAWRAVKNDLPRAIRRSANAGRLLALPDLAADVEFCARMDVFDVVPRRGADGNLRNSR